MFLGCDTGGTFTDFVMYRREGEGPGVLTTLKLSSTPHNPSLAVLEGVARLCGSLAPEQINHATTVATNCLLEKTGGQVAFFVTEGFGDLLWLGRGDRRALYALAPSRVLPPLARDDCFEVAERVLANGQVERPLDLAKLGETLDQLPSPIEALAVCLLHSCTNDEHEKQVREHALQRGLKIFLSSESAPGVGEYERGMTTLLAAYLSPRVDHYLARLEESLGPSSLRIVHSAGGLLKVEEARRFPHRIALSGPAAGLRGALSVGLSCGQPDLVTLDMGGTSTDVALLSQGELPYQWETQLEGYPLRAATLDIHTIGAGGGSIAHLAPTGLLAVGPRSAGAQPGPACYGRGGDRPTVTDALCWCGFLPDRLGDDQLRLDRNAATEALKLLAHQSGLDLEETVEGILQITVTHLAEAVRKVTTGQGHDPGQYTLFPFGGAGPILACQVAESLEMETILVPEGAGVLSAWGALTAPWEREWSYTLPPDERLNPGAARTALETLRRQAGLELTDHHPTEWQPLLARRYKGQGETLVARPEEDFHQLHERRFGFFRQEQSVETVEVKWRARQQPMSISVLSNPSSLEADGQTQVYWNGNFLETPTFRARRSLERGPALFLLADSTLWVGPDWGATLLPANHLLLRRVQS